MELKLVCALKNDYRFFRKYLVYYLPTYKNEIERPYLHTFDEYFFCLKIIELDKEFRNTLSKDEAVALKEWSHSANKSMSFIVKNAFEKWKRIFFKSKLFDDLNPKLMGIVLMALRIQNDKTKTDIANSLDVDRKTIHLIERGDRLPSLDLIYKYSKLFNVSIDKIIKLASN